MNKNRIKTLNLCNRVEIQSSRGDLTAGVLRAILEGVEDDINVEISLVDSGRGEISISHDHEAPVVHVVIGTYDEELRPEKIDLAKTTSFAREIGFDDVAEDGEVEQ